MKSGSRLRALLLLLTGSMCVTTAFADGRIFNTFATAAPTAIPDQQAIIVYDAAKHMETLAIETRFIPPATTATPQISSSDATKGVEQPASFAWVVPLPGPNPPAIRPATTGLFPTVRAIFQPPVVNSGSGLSFPFILVTVLILLALCFTVLSGARKAIGLLLFIFILLLFFLLLFPSIGSARASSESLVQILDRTTVGSFDITVIGTAATTADPSRPLEAGKQLTAWLKDNGFTMPSGVEPVLDDYAARHWVFAACKLRNPPASFLSQPLTPHPLIFTFSTDQCVYPLKLTGVGNGPLSVDLYVFSSMRASAPGFDEVRCEELEPSDFFEEPERHFGPPLRVTLAHPELHTLAEATTVATKLSATLSPRQQTADAVLTWLPAHTSGNIKYSEQGAFERALDSASASLLVGVIALIFIAAVKQNNRWVFRKIAWVLLIALAVGGSVYAALPKVEILPGRYHTLWAHSSYVELTFTTSQEILESNAAEWIKEKQLRGEPGIIDSADALRAIDLAQQSLNKTIPAQPRHEDSPFNFTLEPGLSKGALDFVWYDAVGAPKRLQLWPPTPHNDAKLHRMR